MTPEEIEAKADGILAEQKRVDKCIEAGICPEDGHILASEWTEERHFLWFRWTARVDGFNATAYVDMKCTKCGAIYTRW